MSKVGRIVVVVSCVLWRRVFFMATFFDVESIPSFTTPFLFFILISSHFKGLKCKTSPGEHTPGPPQVTHAIKTHSTWAPPVATLITQTTKASPPRRDLPLPALFGPSPRWIALPRRKPRLRAWQVVFHIQYCHDNQANHVGIIIVIFTIFYSHHSDTEKQNRKLTGNYREQHGIDYTTRDKQFLNQCAVDWCLFANKERNKRKIMTFFNLDVLLASFLADTFESAGALKNMADRYSC